MQINTSTMIDNNEHWEGSNMHLGAKGQLWGGSTNWDGQNTQGYESKDEILCAIILPPSLDIKS